MSEYTPPSQPELRSLHYSLSALAIETDMCPKNNAITASQGIMSVDALPPITKSRFPVIHDHLPIFYLNILDKKDPYASNFPNLCSAAFIRFAPPDGREPPADMPPYDHIEWSLRYSMYYSKDAQFSITSVLTGARRHTPVALAGSGEQTLQRMEADERADGRRTRVTIPKGHPGSRGTPMPPVSARESRQLMKLATLTLRNIQLRD
ncbi:MAG TPA: hypothetical protein VLE73_01040 [Candidatus Saccharimonadales bacterium]|nr:hypothetical protein [Candidatus Saccharimonadales bacterium]